MNKNLQNYLDNRDYKYYSKTTNKVNTQLYVKTVLARNPIEKLFFLYRDYPKLFKQSWNELVFVWSRDNVSWVKEPISIDNYFKGKETLKNANSNDFNDFLIERYNNE